MLFYFTVCNLLIYNCFSASISTNTSGDSNKTQLPDSPVVRSSGWGQPCHLLPNILQRTIQYLENAPNWTWYQTQTHPKLKVRINWIFHSQIWALDRQKILQHPFIESNRLSFFKVLILAPYSDHQKGSIFKLTGIIFFQLYPIPYLE